MVPAPSKKSPQSSSALVSAGSTAGSALAVGLEQRSFSGKALSNQMKSFFSRNWQLILMVSIILAASQVTRSAEKKAEAADQARQIAESREKLKNQKLEEAEKQAATAKKEAAIAKEAKAESDTKAASSEKLRQTAEKKFARITDNQWCGLSVCAYRQRAIEA